MTCGFWNVFGFNDNAASDNHRVREAGIQHLDLDLIGIAETKLTGDNVLNIPGYTWFGHNRTALHARARVGSGGVGFFVKNELMCDYNVSVLDKAEEGILWIRLQCKCCDLVISACVCYVPPVNTTRDVCVQSFLDTLISHIYMYQNDGPFYLCGDFNARLGDRLDYIAGVDEIPDRDVIDLGRNAYGESFADFLVNINCCVLNGRNMRSNDFTSVSSRGLAVVDYCVVPYGSLDMFTNSDCVRAKDLFTASGMVGHVDPEHGGVLSDHSVLTWSAEFVHGGHGSRRADPVSTPGVTQTKFDCSTVPGEFLNNPAAAAQLDQLIASLEQTELQQQGVDAVYEDFCTVIKQEMVRLLPSKTFTIRDGRSNKRRRVRKDWWTNELTDHWNRVCDAEKSWTSCRTPRKRELKHSYVTTRRAFDKAVQRAKRAYWWSTQERIQSMTSGDSRTFWKEIGKVGIAKDRSSNIPMEVRLEDDTISSDVDVVMDTWASAFGQLLNPTGTVPAGDAASSQPTVIEDQSQEDDVFNADITPDEIEAALRRAKNNKACGPDNVPVEVLRSPGAIRFLCVLFNKAFSEGCPPTAWNKCIINPIPKSSTADPRDPLSYRGIALASSVYKLFCGVINQRLSMWAEDNNVLNDAQNGFRRGRGTGDHLCTLSSLIESRKLKNKATYTAFIDFKKAYDSVNRQFLWGKLEELGVRGKTLRALRSLYAQSLYSVRVNGHMSEWIEATCGLKQGCLLSPLLFNLYINDLVSVIEDTGCGVDLGEEKVAILLYADDVALLAETEGDLQVMLDCLHGWCSRWQLNVNATKSAVVHFRKPSVPRTQCVFTCGDMTIPTVDQYKYLGLIFTEHLDFDKMANMVASSASRALGLLIAKVKTMGGVPFDTYTKLYDSMVWPIIDYGAAVWGTKNRSCVEAVHNRAGRFFLGVKKYTPTTAVTGDMGWVSPSERVWTAVARQWHRFAVMNTSRLTKKVFSWCASLASRRVPNWPYKVQQQWESLDLGQLVDLEVAGQMSRRYLTQLVSSAVGRATEVKWHDDLNRVGAKRGQGRNKLRTYRQFKLDPGTEDYVRALLPPTHRSALAKFRCGTAPLRIETGRYEGLAEDDRTCFACNYSCVEDELHVLTVCPLYHDIRTELYDACNSLVPNFNTFTDREKMCYILGCSEFFRLSAKACKNFLNRRSIFYYK